MAGYIELQHTADVCLRAWGKTIEALFEQCARGMIQILEPQFGIGESIVKQLDVFGSDDEDLLVEFLSMILFWIEVDKAACVDMNLNYRASCLSGEITCQPYIMIARNIKAVTYHDLAIKLVNGEFVTELVFDL